MRNIILILFLLISCNVVAQQRLPTGTPTQFSTGWFKQGIQQSDSMTIIANRDTSFKAKYSGTIVFRPGNRKFYYFDSTILAWLPLAPIALDTTSLSNRINLKLNISDTVGAWLSQSSRLVDTVYRVNDSTVGYTIKGIPYTFQILGRSSGGSGSGLTSVGLSMPSAFSVSGSPLTSDGTINISGAGTTSQYIRGNGTLATTDTGMIPNFYSKVRSLFFGVSPITLGDGNIGITNANTTGQKGAATFSNSDFIDNGAGLISLRNPSGNPGVDTIYRTSGIDSIYYIINGATYAILDSTGAGSSGITQLSGDVVAGPGSGSQVATISNNAVTNAKFRQSAALSVIGNSTNSTANIADITAGSDNQILRRSGTTIGFGSINLASSNAVGSSILPIANGGTGTATPGLIAGTNVTITGSWPNQTINASGGGGSGTVTQVNSGYGLGGGPITTTGTLTVDSSALKSVFLPLHLNSDKIVYQNGNNIYFTGSGQLQSDSIKFTELTAPPAITEAVVLGNSIMYGQGASVVDSSLKGRAANYYGVTLIDLSLSGSGVWRMASNFYLNIDPGQQNLTMTLAGLNDVRRNALPTKTYNKIVNGYQAVFINQYMDTYVPAIDVSVIKTAGWASGYAASSVGGKSVNGGILSTTAGDTATWNFTGTNVAVGLMGSDSVGGSSYEYGNGKIFIDNVFIMNIREGDQWDGVSDGVNDNKRGTYPLFFTGLSNGSHTIKIVQNDPGVFLVIDYFATLVDPSVGKPMIMVHAPYLNSAGYATSPNMANDLIIDRLNSTIDSLYNVFVSNGYPVYLSRTENCYDTLTGLGPDNIHPNDLGYQQIFNCVKAAAPSFGTQATKGTIYYANDGYFYGSKDGLPKRIAYVGDTSSYILNRVSTTQTAGFKINGTGTLGTVVAPTAHLGNITSSSSSGVLLDFTPVASQAVMHVGGTISGSVITYYSDASVSNGLLWVQRNTSSSNNAYSAVALAVQGGGDATGGAQVSFRNDAIAKEYVTGLNPVNDRYEIRWGNQDQFNGLHLLGIDSTGQIHLRMPTSGATTDSVLLYRASDSSVRQIATSALGSGVTIYNGNGTLSSNRTITGNNLSLTLDTIFNFRVNANTFILDQKAKGFPYTASVIASNPHNYQLGYTPTPTVYTKGAGLYIDTNNNVGLGASVPSSIPLYSTGLNTYANIFQAGGSVFYNVATITSSTTATTTNQIFLIDATSGNITVTLPAASGVFGSSVGIYYRFKRVDNTGNTVTIQRAGSDTIDGGTNFTLTTQYQVKEIMALSTSSWGIF